MSNFKNLEAAGAEVKRDKKNQLIIGFTSQKISDAQLRLLSTIDTDCLLAFYSCGFSSCDLGILKEGCFNKIALIYCRFGDAHLFDICEMPKLNWIKLYDTQVTSEAVKKILDYRHDLEILLN